MSLVRVSTLALLLLAVRPAGAETAGSESLLDSISVVATGVSSVVTASQGDVDRAQIESQPLLRPAAVLESVPGLIVTQHSGEGKANQYFLRAFNLDHGTDFAIDVDDMPVNMPTHAHGQGYSDLNFLIPEVVADLHYQKGTYYADEGDFATAGAARIDLRNEAAAAASLGFGEYGFRRALVLGSTVVAAGSMLGAVEVYHNDGPFEVPDDYNRSSGVLRFHQGEPDDFLSVTAMAYTGKWNSSDQVPLRVISEGLIGRFGSLNPTDGGESERSSLSFSRVRRNDTGQSQFSAYVIRYRLNLWSTFTFYLQDPQFGDQMLQKDDRVVYGFKGSRTWYASIGDLRVSTVIGTQGRFDDIRDVGIFSTVQRRTIGVRQDAGITESSGALYAESTIRWLPRLVTTLGLRDDAFSFDVRDKMLDATGRCSIASDPLGCDTGSRRTSIVSPKLSVALGPWHDVTLFFNTGEGYHSNDARGVTRSGENPAATPVTPLTRASGSEAGIAAEPLQGWDLRLDLFQLKLRSELVFSGDAGVTSASGATTRTGIELGSHYRLASWLSADLNGAYTKARFDIPAAPDDLGCSNAAASHPCSPPLGIVGRYVPDSPTNVLEAGLTAKRESGWFGSLRARHFGESPLVEDNSARAAAYTTVDLQFGFRQSTWQAELDLFNVANVRWNDITYYYVSRLRREPYAVADYVVHPGVPRTLHARFIYDF